MNTYYGLEALDSGEALFASLVIGFFFGLALERAGFGSSRRISGVFYFTDMAVLKVMFSALIVAMLGLAFFSFIGLLDISTQIYTLKTYYGAFVVGGLLFGVGFAISGWCPGTAMVGLASGKMDALVFLAGAILGSILFNELFPIIEPLATWGRSAQSSFDEPGLAFIYKSLGISESGFLLLFTVVAVLCFWVAEYLEKVKSPEKGGAYWNSPFLKAFCLLLVGFAVSLPLLSSQEMENQGAANIPSEEAEKNLSSTQEYISPEELADRMLKRDSAMTVVDIRPESDYRVFHIRGALNVQLSDLPAFVAENGGKGMIVLYSDSMAHESRAREGLFRMGFPNVTILTGGLNGFLEKCLKPVSLRPEPVSREMEDRIRSWRDYFLSPES